MEPKRKRVLNGRNESVVLNPKPSDLPMSRLIEMVADEVWVAVKFQSNSEIAGSLRNSFRASL